MTVASLNKSAVAVVLGSIRPGELDKSAVAVVLATLLPPAVSQVYSRDRQMQRLYLGSTPIQSVFLGGTQLFRQS